MADRVGVINAGKLLLLEEKSNLLNRLGRKQLTLQLLQPLKKIPAKLNQFDIELSGQGDVLKYFYDINAQRTGVITLMKALSEEGIRFTDLNTQQSSLEEIFIDLLNEPEQEFEGRD